MNKQVMTFLCVPLLVLFLLSGCGTQAEAVSSFKLPLAQDKLTFIFFFSDH